MPLTKTVTAYMDLTAEDVGDRCHVRVRIVPMAQNQDMLARSQLAQGLRTPGAGGKPLVDDLTLLEELFPDLHPGTIAERLREETLVQQSQEIAKLVLAASEQEFLENNKNLLKKADKRLNPEGLPPIPPEHMQAIQRIMELLKNGADMNVLMQAMQAAEGGGTGMPMGAPGQPPGVSPSALPSQMMMSPEEALPNPVTLPAKQARRGKEAN